MTRCLLYAETAGSGLQTASQTGNVVQAQVCERVRFVQQSLQALQAASPHLLIMHYDVQLSAGAYRGQVLSWVCLTLSLALHQVRIACATARCPGGSAQSQCAPDETCWQRSARASQACLMTRCRLLGQQAAALVLYCACGTCNRGRVPEGRAHTHRHICLARPDSLPQMCRAGVRHGTPRRTWQWALHCTHSVSAEVVQDCLCHALVVLNSRACSLLVASMLHMP